MLQLHHRTCAPSAVRVSMSTAVCTVMCNEPVMRAPFSGWASANSARNAMSPGISCSASSISLRPNAARDRSATLKSSAMSSYLRECASERIARLGPAGPLMTAQAGRTLLCEGGLDLFENGDRTGVDALLRGEVQARHASVEHEVEQLGERTVAGGVHLLDRRHYFVGPLPHELEAAHHLWVLLVVTEQHERKHLPRHVAVLPPTLDLVVGQLRHGVHERRRLCILVDLVLPPRRRSLPETLTAVDERDRAPELPRQIARAVRFLRQLVATAAQLLDREGDPPSRAREQTGLLEHRQGRDRHRSETGARIWNAFRHADEHRVPRTRQSRQLAALRHHHHARAGKC